MPDWRLTTIENLVFTAPEHEFAHIFRKSSWRSRDEVQGRGNRGIQVWVTYQLPADFIDEGQTNVEDHKVDIREASPSPIHVPRLRMFDGLRTQGHTFMQANTLPS